MMVYSKYGPEPSRIPLIVGDAEIQPVSSLRSLGVILDSHLTMDAQIRSSCKKAFFHLRRLQIKKFHSQSALAQLIHAFVISQIDYCNSLLAGLSKTSLKRLQRVQNSAARLLKGVRKCDPITPTLLDLHWLPVTFRIDFKIALLTYRCLNCNNLTYFIFKVNKYYSISLILDLYSPRQLVQDSGWSKDSSTFLY